MSDNWDALLSDTWNYISKTKESLEAKNRFFTDERFLYSLKKIFEESSHNYKPNTTFYRSRIYKADDKFDKLHGSAKGQVFQGYDAKESFVNTQEKWAQGGRMNPAGVIMLYVSSDENTSIRELHPAANELISVAKVVNDSPLKIADLSKSDSMMDDDSLRYLSVYIQDLLSQGYSEKDYVFPRYIAACCQHLGYDGIGFRSKYALRSDVKDHKGINITIFNYENCHAISSKLVRVKKISTQTEDVYQNANDVSQNVSKVNKDILKYISMFPNCTAKDIEAYFNVSSQAVYRKLQDLQRQGYIVPTCEKGDRVKTFVVTDKSELAYALE